MLQLINDLWPTKFPPRRGGGGGAGVSWLRGVDATRQCSGAAESAGFTAVAETKYFRQAPRHRQAQPRADPRMRVETLERLEDPSPQLLRDCGARRWQAS